MIRKQMLRQFNRLFVARPRRIWARTALLEKQKVDPVIGEQGVLELTQCSATRCSVNSAETRTYAPPDREAKPLLESSRFTA